MAKKDDLKKIQNSYSIRVPQEIRDNDEVDQEHHGNYGGISFVWLKPSLN